MPNAARLHPNQSAVTAVSQIPASRSFAGVTNNAFFPSGQKIATRTQTKSSAVRKYDQIIGAAAEYTTPGDHAHMHDGALHKTSEAYAFGTVLRPETPVAETARDTVTQFRCNNGALGIRNYIAIITSVNCPATAARRIADAFGPEELSAYRNVDGVLAFVHGKSCGMAGDGEGFKALQRMMWGHAEHPDIAGVLMVGLDCEVTQIDWLLEAYSLGQGPLFQTMNIQNVSGLQKTIDIGTEKVRAMLPLAKKARGAPCPASELKITPQCGGSDAGSRIMANPALDRACDLLAAQDGTDVLAETPEIYGEERMLTSRAVDEAAGQKLIDLSKRWEDCSQRNYAEPVTARNFNYMDSPGFDPDLVTEQITDGCNLVCFTTGRGSAFGSRPAPTIKAATNSATYQRTEADMDINAGPILSACISVQDKGREICEMFLRVASREFAKSEARGLGDYEFAPWQIGAVT